MKWKIRKFKWSMDFLKEMMMRMICIKLNSSYRGGRFFSFSRIDNHLFCVCLFFSRFVYINILHPRIQPVAWHFFRGVNSFFLLECETFFWPQEWHTTEKWISWWQDRKFIRCVDDYDNQVESIGQREKNVKVHCQVLLFIFIGFIYN